MSGLKLLVGVMLVVVASAMMVLNVSTTDNPSIIFLNESGQEVIVTASRDGNDRKLGTIAAGAKRTFKVRDESALMLMVSYADGRGIESSSIYFTSGVDVTATVTNAAINITHADTH